MLFVMSAQVVLYFIIPREVAESVDISELGNGRKYKASLHFDQDDRRITLESVIHFRQPRRAAQTPACEARP